MEFNAFAHLGEKLANPNILDKKSEYVWKQI